MNVDKSPIEGVPDFAIKVVSESNLAQDMLTRVHQYLAAGAKAVSMSVPSPRAQRCNRVTKGALLI